MEFIKNLQLLLKKYDETSNGSTFVKKTYQTKLNKYKEVFDVDIESLISNCLKILNANGQFWSVNVFVQQSYDKALGFSSTPVGEYRYENVYKIEFVSKNANKTVYLPLLSFRMNAKSKFEYVKNPFPKDIKVNLLDLYFNEKKLEKLFIPLTRQNKINNNTTDFLTDILWVMIKQNTKNLILNRLLPEEIEKLCSLYENNAPKDEIENCKNTIKTLQYELKMENNKEK